MKKKELEKELKIYKRIAIHHLGTNIQKMFFEMPKMNKERVQFKTKIQTMEMKKNDIDFPRFDLQVPGDKEMVFKDGYIELDLLNFDKQDAVYRKLFKAKIIECDNIEFLYPERHSIKWNGTWAELLQLSSIMINKNAKASLAFFFYKIVKGEKSIISANNLGKKKNKRTHEMDLFLKEFQ